MPTEQEFLEKLIAWLKDNRDGLAKDSEGWDAIDALLDAARDSYYSGQMPWERSHD